MKRQRKTVSELARELEAKRGLAGIASELYAAVLRGEVDFPSKKARP